MAVLSRRRRPQPGDIYSLNFQTAVATAEFHMVIGLTHPAMSSNLTDFILQHAGPAWTTISEGRLNKSVYFSDPLPMKWVLIAADGLTESAVREANQRCLQ